MFKVIELTEEDLKELAKVSGVLNVEDDFLLSEIRGEFPVIINRGLSLNECVDACTFTKNMLTTTE